MNVLGSDNRVCDVYLFKVFKRINKTLIVAVNPSKPRVNELR